VPEVALVTYHGLPELDPDDQLLLAPLAALGCRVTAVSWDDASIDWDRFDLTVIRSTWDYTDRRDEFLAWARLVPRLLNPASVVEWNTDKRYLADLVAAGLLVIETQWLTAGGSAPELELPTSGEYVLKPSVGAGSIDANRFDLGDDRARELGLAHARRLLARGQTVMVQPFAHAIEEVGETGVILVDGEYSHAMRKGVMLGPQTLEEVEELYKEETIDARVASSAEIDLAQRAVTAVPVGSAELLYARVDMVPDASGQPMIMELELTEPSLFMVTSAGSEMRFASAIAARARQMASTRT
jgi:hypothetical protein